VQRLMASSQAFIQGIKQTVRVQNCRVGAAALCRRLLPWRSDTSNILRDERTFVLLRVSVQPAECALVTLWASSSQQQPLSGLSASAAHPQPPFPASIPPATLRRTAPTSTAASPHSLSKRTCMQDLEQPKTVPVPCFHRTTVNCSTPNCRGKLF